LRKIKHENTHIDPKEGLAPASYTLFKIKV